MFTSKKNIILVMMCLWTALFSVQCKNRKVQNFTPNLTQIISDQEPLLSIDPLDENAPVHQMVSYRQTHQYLLDPNEGLPQISEQNKTSNAWVRAELVNIEGEFLKITLPESWRNLAESDLSLIAYKRAVYLETTSHALKMKDESKIDFVKMDHQKIGSIPQGVFYIDPLNYVDPKNPNQEFIIQFAIVQNYGINSNSYTAIPNVAIVKKDENNNLKVRFFDKNAWGNQLAKLAFFSSTDAIKSVISKNQNNELIITFRAPKPDGISANDLDDDLCYWGFEQPICYTIALAMRRAIHDNGSLKPTDCVKNISSDYCIPNGINTENTQLDNKYVQLFGRNQHVTITDNGQDLMFSMPLSTSYHGNPGGYPLTIGETREDIDIQHIIPSQLLVSSERVYAKERGFIYGAPNFSNPQTLNSLPDFNETQQNRLDTSSKKFKKLAIGALFSGIAIVIVVGVVVAVSPWKTPVCNTDQYLENGKCHKDYYKIEYGPSFGYRVDTKTKAKQCNYDSEWIPNKQECVLKCTNPEEPLLQVTGFCRTACPAGQEWNGSSCKKIPCINGHGPNCVVCKEHETFDPSQDKCICTNGNQINPINNKCSTGCKYGLDENGNCLPTTDNFTTTYEKDYQNHYLQVHLKQTIGVGFSSIQQSYYSDIIVTTDAGTSLNPSFWCKEGCQTFDTFLPEHTTSSVKRKVFGVSPYPFVFKDAEIKLPHLGYIFAAKWGE